MKRDIIYGVILTLVVIIFTTLNVLQGLQINKLETEIGEVKMVNLDDGESVQESIEMTQSAIIDVHNRLEEFIVVHDENIEIINAMQTTLWNVVDYLSN